MPTGTQRQAAIMNRLHHDGAFRYTDLARTLGVSAITIRRDVQVLARHGHLTPVHDGAIACWPTDCHIGHADEGTAIAARATCLVAAHTTIGLGPGSITTQMARNLARTPGLTVVTTSPSVALAFGHDQSYGQQVLLTGGTATATGQYVGPIALATIRQLALDQLFLQFDAIDPARGLLSLSHAHAETDRALISVARHLVVLARHSAWNTLALAPAAPRPPPPP
ncbi:MAG TPA: DeoR/GlpR family DNA-binding transcription regulator [Actinocrinis sp.]|nr:DeoR/GlpR family DNA-binding transcription regulator [Actinocrinis sp.]